MSDLSDRCYDCGVQIRKGNLRHHMQMHINEAREEWEKLAVQMIENATEASE